MGKQELENKILHIVREYSSQNSLLGDRKATKEIMQLLEPEQVSKTVYEIMAYRHIPTSEATGKPVVIWKHEKRPWWEVAEANIDNEYAINTVRRFSDGELFQIGDKVWSVTKSLGVFTIKGFIMDEEAGGGLAITTNEGTMQIAITCTVKHQEPVVEESTDMRIGEVTYTIPKSIAEEFNKAIQEVIGTYIQNLLKSQRRYL